MSLPRHIEMYLRGLDIPYQPLSHTSCPRIQQVAQVVGIEPCSVARAVLLQCARGLQLVVLPAPYSVDFSRLEQLLGMPVELAPASLGHGVFTDCDPCTAPTVGAPYGVPVLVDASLDELPLVNLAVGRHDVLITLSKQAFTRLFWGCARADFGVAPGVDDDPRTAPSDTEADMNQYVPECENRQCLERLYALPPLPASVSAILKLREDPAAEVADLAALVAQDPSLAAQVVRYARSPFFGYRGEINTLEDAIHRVLGFELVVNMAIGLSAGRAFRNPCSGPLGLESFWRHATYTASLAQELGRSMPPRQRPRLGTVYLAGLLHNFGFLVLGHLFPPEFAMLNRLAAANPDKPVRMLERQILAMGEARQMVRMGHARVGAWLMTAWGMPGELVTAVLEHHNEGYRGEHDDIVALVLLADRLARREELGDGDGAALPPAVLNRLGLDEAAVEAAYQRVEACREDLDFMARQLAA